jgi:eukaryotic-like serine/threonine-protein kinase
MSEPANPARETSVAAMPPAVPLVIPDHELIRVIGGGSSGEVWLARNVLGSYRAVKIVREKAFAHRRAFQGEFDGVLKFEPVSRLHDGLMDILQVGRNDAAGYFYYVMELGDDVSTGQVIIPENYSPRTLACDYRQRRRLPIGECVRLGAAIASALGYLHRNGLIHRDVKPSNIIFVNGFPKLADAGLVSELSESGSRVGTEGFIAPEGAGTPQADIYSLGKVLYEISTGKDRNEYPTLPSPLEDSAEGRDLVRFNKIVLNACRADPSRRFKSADEMMTVLLAFQFSHYHPRIENARQRFIRVICTVGPFIGFGVIIGLLWRLIWLLEHSP